MIPWIVLGAVIVYVVLVFRFHRLEPTPPPEPPQLPGAQREFQALVSAGVELSELARQFPQYRNSINMWGRRQILLKRMNQVTYSLEVPR